MQVHEVMTSDIRTIQSDASIQDAAVMMRSFDVGSLPVCDGPRLVGIVTDRDIAVRICAAGLSPAQTSVSDAMTSSVVTCTEYQEVAEVAGVMEGLQIRRLPVVNEDHELSGMISLADIVTLTGDRGLAGEILQHVCERPMIAI